MEIRKAKADRTTRHDRKVQLQVQTSTLLSTIDRTTRQKINKDVEELTTTIHDRIQSRFYKTPLNNSRTHILFKCPRNMFQDRPHHSNMVLLFLSSLQTLVDVGRFILLERNKPSQFQCLRSVCKCMRCSSEEASIYSVLMGFLLTDKCTAGSEPK